jgi:chromosome segregation ATPase
MPDNTPSTAAQSAAKTPADKVKELQDTLKQKEDELAKLTKARDAFKTDVDSLAKNPAEIDKAKADAAKNLPQIIEDREQLIKYKADTLKGTVALLGPEKQAKVDETIKQVDQKISDQRSKLPGDRKAVRDTEDAARAAQEDLDKKQKSYDNFKGLEKDNFKLLGDLKKSIDTLNDVPKPASMYVLLREMNSALTVVAGIPGTDDEFETELVKRWNALEQAKETARTAKLNYENAKTQLASDESTLAALEKSRVDDLLAATDEFNK